MAAVRGDEPASRQLSREGWGAFPLSATTCIPAPPSTGSSTVHFLIVDNQREHAMLEHSTRPTSLTKFKDCLRVPPILHPDTADEQRYRLWIQMRPAHRQLHSELPPSKVWTYEGSLPGPTIEVWRGQRVQVEWINALPGDQPYPITAPDGSQPESSP